MAPAGAALIGMGAFIAYQAAAQGTSIGLRLTLAVAAALPFVLGVLLLWMLRATSYEITESEPICHVGPFRWRAPLDAIEEIVSTKGMRPVMGLGLAWSTDMLHVKRRKKNGTMAYPVSISPLDKTGFLGELKTATPGVKVIGNPTNIAAPGRTTV